jgi:small subunit ribosomal protein S11
MAQKKQRTKKRERKNVLHAVVHIKATFNNTTITFTDQQGNVICWSDGRQRRLQGQPQVDAVRRPGRRRAGDQGRDRQRRPQGRRPLQGPGLRARDRDPHAAAMGVEVLSIKDVTPVPHNGCRPPKRRRG